MLAISFCSPSVLTVASAFNDSSLTLIPNNVWAISSRSSRLIFFRSFSCPASSRWVSRRRLRSNRRDSFNNFVWCRDDRWVYIARNDGAEAKLYDVVADADHREDVSATRPDVVAEMRSRVVADAGGEPLPIYDQQSIMAREWYRLP